MNRSEKWDMQHVTNLDKSSDAYTEEKFTELYKNNEVILDSEEKRINQEK